MPKESARVQMIEAKSNLLRLQETIPLTEPELAAVEEGIAAYDKLVESLRDVRTPPAKQRANWLRCLPGLPPQTPTTGRLRREFAHIPHNW